MVCVYAMDISNLPSTEEKAFADLLVTLDVKRQNKITELKSDLKKKQSLGAGLLLKYVLERHGLKTEDIQMGPHGKPEIEGLQFNLSHSGTTVICAASHLPVGCDIEENRPMPEAYGSDFLRLWTAKESYGKMTGEGLSIPKDTVEIRTDEDLQVFRDGVLQKCFLKEYVIPGYQMTVCAEEEMFSDVQWVNGLYN